MAKWGEINCAALEERLEAAQRDAKEAEEALAETDALWEGMERSLEESDAREVRLERWLEESETREATLNDRITILEEHLCLTEEKLALVIAAYRIEAMRRNDYSHDAFDQHIAALKGQGDA